MLMCFKQYPPDPRLCDYQVIQKIYLITIFSKIPFSGGCRILNSLYHLSDFLTSIGYLFQSIPYKIFEFEILKHFYVVLLCFFMEYTKMWLVLKYVNLHRYFEPHPNQQIILNKVYLWGNVNWFQTVSTRTEVVWVSSDQFFCLLTIKNKKFQIFLCYFYFVFWWM